MHKTFPIRLSEAAQDFQRALCATETWVFLGWHDIRQRYRRSTLGPFWITISTAVLVGGLGVMYAGLFSMDISQYLPYLAVGLVTWNFMANVITESCTVFTGAEGSIKSGQIPISSYVLRLIWRNLIIFLHNAVVLFSVVLWFLPFRPLNLAIALLGLVVIATFLFWLSLLVGLLSARFRDIPQIVTNVLQTIFFMTPIMWHANVLKTHTWVAKINPFFYMLELVRAPLLGDTFDWMQWGSAAIVISAVMLVAWLLFARFRTRIVYWL